MYCVLCIVHSSFPNFCYRFFYCCDLVFTLLLLNRCVRFWAVNVHNLRLAFIRYHSYRWSYLFRFSFEIHTWIDFHFAWMLIIIACECAQFAVFNVQCAFGCGISINVNIVLLHSYLQCSYSFETISMVFTFFFFFFEVDQKIVKTFQYEESYKRKYTNISFCTDIWTLILVHLFTEKNRTKIEPFVVVYFSEVNFRAWKYSDFYNFEMIVFVPFTIVLIKLRVENELHSTNIDCTEEYDRFLFRCVYSIFVLFFPNRFDPKPKWRYEKTELISLFWCFHNSHAMERNSSYLALCSMFNLTIFIVRF